jgi:hypothetical protein
VEPPAEPVEPPEEPQEPGEDPQAPFEAVLADAGGMLLPELSGTAEPGTVVEILVDDAVTQSVTTGEEGTWHAVVDAPPGAHVLAARPAGSPDDVAVLGEVLLLAPTVHNVQHQGTLQPVLVVAWDRADEELVAVATVDEVPTGERHQLGPQTVLLQLEPLADPPVEDERTVVVTLRYLDPTTGRQGAARVVPVLVGPAQPPTVGGTPL